MDVFFCDESGFSLQPYIPYCYQKKGTQLAIPSSRTKVLNVLGFLNPITEQLITYKLPDKENMNSENFITFLNDFSNKITAPTALIKISR